MPEFDLSLVFISFFILAGTGALFTYLFATLPANARDYQTTIRSFSYDRSDKIPVNNGGWGNSGWK